MELNPAFRDYKERTTKIADVLQNLRKENEICALKGWRDEVHLISTFDIIAINILMKNKIINYEFM